MPGGPFQSAAALLGRKDPLPPSPVTPNTRPWYRRFMNKAGSVFGTMKRKASNTLKSMKRKVTNYFDPKYAYARALANANSNNDRIVKARNITRSYYNKKGKLASLPGYLTRNNANARNAAAKFLRENPFWKRKMRGVRRTANNIQRRFRSLTAKVAPAPVSPTAPLAVALPAPHEINANLQGRANRLEGKRLKKDINDKYAALIILQKELEQGKPAHNANIAARAAAIAEKRKKHGGILHGIGAFFQRAFHHTAEGFPPEDPLDLQEHALQEERAARNQANALGFAEIARIEREIAGNLANLRNLRARTPNVENAPNDPRQKNFTAEQMGPLMAAAAHMAAALQDINEEKIKPLLKVITEQGIKDDTSLLKKDQFKSPVTITVKYLKDFFEDCLKICKAMMIGDKMRKHVKDLRKYLEKINEIKALAPKNDKDMNEVITAVGLNVATDLLRAGTVFSAPTKIGAAVAEFQTDNNGTLAAFKDAFEQMEAVLRGFRNNA